MVGNLQEWVGLDEDAAALIGGSWYYKDKASCRASYTRFGPGMANRTTGFRCCADDAVEAAATEAPALGEGAQLVAKGETFPAFGGPGLDGERIDSERLTGKVALINFWASWCTPCRKELPALAGLYGRTDRDAFEIIAVNVDRDPALARRFLAQQALPFPVVVDPASEIVGQFDVTAMPTSVLIDHEGRVVERHAGFSEAWFEELEQRIGQLVDARP